MGATTLAAAPLLGLPVADSLVSTEVITERLPPAKSRVMKLRAKLR
jgi:hypothetical protein